MKLHNLASVLEEKFIQMIINEHPEEFKELTKGGKEAEVIGKVFRFCHEDYTGQHAKLAKWVNN